LKSVRIQRIFTAYVRTFTAHLDGEKREPGGNNFL